MYIDTINLNICLDIGIVYRDKSFTLFNNNKNAKYRVNKEIFKKYLN